QGVQTGEAESRAYGRGLALFVHVFDAGFVQQNIGFAVTVYFEAALVVPLNHPVESLAIPQNEYHRSLGLHLLYVIKILRIGLIRRNRFFLLLATPGRRDLFLDFVQRRTNEFTVYSFHGMPSFLKKL